MPPMPTGVSARRAAVREWISIASSPRLFCPRREVGQLPRSRRLRLETRLQEAAREGREDVLRVLENRSVHYRRAVKAVPYGRTDRTGAVARFLRQLLRPFARDRAVQPIPAGSGGGTDARYLLHPAYPQAPACRPFDTVREGRKPVGRPMPPAVCPIPYRRKTVRRPATG